MVFTQWLQNPSLPSWITCFLNVCFPYAVITDNTNDKLELNFNNILNREQVYIRPIEAYSLKNVFLGTVSDDWNKFTGRLWPLRGHQNLFGPTFWFGMNKLGVTIYITCIIYFFMYQPVCLQGTQLISITLFNIYLIIAYGQSLHKIYWWKHGD